MPMMVRAGHIVWYAAILGLAYFILNRVLGGITGGLQSGLGKATGLG